MFAKPIERIFDYLDSFFLENLEELQVSGRCLQLFNDVYFKEFKAELRLIIIKEITTIRVT